MLKLREHKELTVDNIIELVSSANIWDRYLPGGIKPFGKAFKSPLRDDKHASCTLLLTKTSDIIMKDHKGQIYNVIQYISNQYGLSWFEALKKINKDFELNLSETITNMNSPIILRKKDKIQNLYNHLAEEEVIISIKRREWKQEDIEYWRRFYINQPTLAAYNIIPISHYWIKKGDLDYFITCDSITYSIEFGNGIRKIYIPEKRKWMTNAKSNMYIGLEHLHLWGVDVIITKSVKDIMVWKVLEYDAIGVQNENVELSYNLLCNLYQKYHNVYLNYDNDETGKRAMERIMNKWNNHNTTFNLIPLYTPKKDISDTIEELGPKYTKEWADITIDKLRSKVEKDLTL